MSDGKNITFQNAKFGTVEVGPEDIIEFPRGFPGSSCASAMGYWP